MMTLLGTGQQKSSPFLSELLGREVDKGECVGGSRLKWHVSNKYYSTEIEFVIHKAVEEVRDSKREYEGFVLMCNLSQVGLCMYMPAP